MHVYLYDGSFDGLLTAIFYAYSCKKEAHIEKEQGYHSNLLASVQLIETEADKADRVYESIRSKLSPNTLSKVYYLYLSEAPHFETLLLRYLKLCYHFSDSINLAKNNEIIHQVDLYCKRVTTERHRMVGFVRFKEIAPMTFYAQIEPDHNILPLIMAHFKRRFSDQPFIIHDLKRNHAIVYNGKEAVLQVLTEKEGMALKTHHFEDPFEALFKSFYKAATIEERINTRRRNAYMPKRYFKHLVEL